MCHVTDDWGDSEVATAIAVVSPDRIIVAASSGSNLLIAGYNADLSTDVAFNRFKLDDARATSLLVEPDGKILIAGSKGAQALLARLSSSGELDSTFGNGGIVTTDLLGEHGAFIGLVRQSDGRVVTLSAPSGQCVMQRFDPDGLTVETFSAVESFSCTTFAMQSEGKVIVAGSKVGSSYDFPQPAAVRLLAGGQLDPAFGASGIVQIDSLGRGAFKRVGFTPEGHILLVVDCYPFFHNQHLVMLEEYTSNGEVSRLADPIMYAYSFDFGEFAVGLSAPVSDHFALPGGSNHRLPIVKLLQPPGSLGQGLMFDAVDGEFAATAIAADGEVFAVGFANVDGKADRDILLAKFKPIWP